MNRLPGVEVIEILRRARPAAARTAGHEDGTVGQNGRVVLSSRKAHGSGRLPRRLSLAHVKQLGVGSRWTAPADVDDFVNVVQDRRRAVSLSIVPLG